MNRNHFPIWGRGKKKNIEVAVQQLFFLNMTFIVRLFTVSQLI